MKLFLKEINIFLVFAIILGSCNFSSKKSAQIKATTLIKSSFSWDNSPLKSYPKGIPEITVLKITIPPKTSLPLHKHPFINVGFLLKGELLITTEEGKKIVFREGEPLIEIVDQWHFGKNESDENVEIIVFYAGISGESVTLLKE